MARALASGNVGPIEADEQKIVRLKKTGTGEKAFMLDSEVMEPSV